jgi:hypothetical protein
MIDHASQTAKLRRQFRVNQCGESANSPSLLGAPPDAIDSRWKPLSVTLFVRPRFLLALDRVGHIRDSP